MPLISLNSGFRPRLSVAPTVVTNAYDPPAGWVQTFHDPFTQPATTGVNALDPAIWKHRSFGSGNAHQGAATWDNGNSTQSTGTTLRVHTRRVNGAWKVDGFLAGIQNTNPSGYAYHPGYGEFHQRFRARMTNAGRGVGAYQVMWPLPDNKWGIEIDVLETPGATKNRSDSTMHWDSRGLYDLNTNNEYRTRSLNVDLTQYHVWDCRRTFSVIDGIVHASIRVWVDGVECGPAPEWLNNRWLTTRTVPGFASYVAPSSAYNWYTAPDSTSPADSWIEAEELSIWEPSGTPVVTKSLSVSPYNPGTLNETSAGAGVTWNTTIKSTGVTAVDWAIVGPAPNYTQRNLISNVATTGDLAVSPNFKADGEFIKTWETGNTSLEAISGAVTINESTTATRSLKIDPFSPGSRPAGPLATTVTTTGITSITWVVVNPDYSWTNGGTPVATTGSVVVNPNYTVTGQFLKVFDTNDSSYKVDGNPVTITA